MSGAEQSAPSESASTPAPAATTDVKTAEPAKEAAAATSAAQTPAPAEVKTEVETDEAKAERTRNEKGQFVSQKEVDELREQLAARSKAHETEKRKRQELERQTKELEETKAKQPKKDIFEDPDGAIEDRVNPLVNQLEQKFESKLFALSEQLAKDRYGDYEAVLAEFMEEVETDPSLGSQAFVQARNATDPAGFLYKFAVNRREIKAAGGDLVKYKADAIAPLKTENERLAAEIKALKTQLDNLGKVPSSLNAEPSAARATVNTEAVENEPLGEIFKPRKRRA